MLGCTYQGSVTIALRLVDFRAELLDHASHNLQTTTMLGCEHQGFVTSGVSLVDIGAIFLDQPSNNIQKICRAANIKAV
jgi:hypothetical protein